MAKKQKTKNEEITNPLYGMPFELAIKLLVTSGKPDTKKPKSKFKNRKSK